MGFQKFDEAGSGRGRNPGAEPMISLRKSGSIGINRPALDAHFDDNAAAVMYYDEEDDAIGIDPVSKKSADDAAYTITRTDSGGTIAPRAFLERYDLVPEVTTQYDPQWDDEAGLVVVDLDDPIGTYGSR